MKKAIRHTAVCLLAGVVLLSSTGLSIHRVYCYCKAESKASLFCAADDPCGEACGESSGGGTCCEGGKCSQPFGQERRGCSDHNSQYFKLDADYLVFSSDFKISAPAAELPPAIFWQKWLPAAVQASASFFEKKAPPPPSGRQLLALVQSFLC